MARRRTSSKRSTKRNCGRNPYREDTYYADREIRKAKKARSRKSKRATKTGMRAVLGRMNPRGGTKYRRRVTAADRDFKGRVRFAQAGNRSTKLKKSRGWKKPAIWAPARPGMPLRWKAHLKKHGYTNPRPNENDIPTVIIVRKGKGRSNPPITPAQARAIKAVLRRHGY